MRDKYEREMIVERERKSIVGER